VNSTTAERRDGGVVVSLAWRQPRRPRVTAPPTPLRERVETLHQGVAGPEVAVAFATLDGRDALMLNEDTYSTPASTIKVAGQVELFSQAGAGRRVGTIESRSSISSERGDGSPYRAPTSETTRTRTFYKAIGTERRTANCARPDPRSAAIWPPTC